jgi:hypothetical protein
MQQWKTTLSALEKTYDVTLEGFGDALALTVAYKRIPGTTQPTPPRFEQDGQAAARPNRAEEGAGHRGAERPSAEAVLGLLASLRGRRGTEESAVDSTTASQSRVVS